MKESKQLRLEEEPILVDEQEILSYLRQHPDFFNRHAEQIGHMTIPHPVQEGTVSLVEWQLSRQRQQIAHLQEEITLLMEAAAANEQLLTQLLELHTRLSGAENLAILLDRLRSWAHALGLNGVALWLFTEQWQLDSSTVSAQLGLSRQQFEPIRIQRMADRHHYLGQLNQSEAELLLPAIPLSVITPPAGQYSTQKNALQQSQGSAALSLLGKQGDLGLLIFSHQDAQHYQPQQDTLLLKHISQWLPEILTRWIARK